MTHEVGEVAYLIRRNVFSSGKTVYASEMISNGSKSCDQNVRSVSRKMSTLHVLNEFAFSQFNSCSREAVKAPPGTISSEKTRKKREKTFL